MAKSSNQQASVSASTEVRTVDGALVNAPDAGVRPEPTPADGFITFSMYCTVRRIPVQRQAGMRAFTKTNEATLSEWDAIFKRY